MHRPKISFAVGLGTKRKSSASGFDEQLANPESNASTSSETESAPRSKKDAVFTSQSSISDKLLSNSLELSAKSFPSTDVRSKNPTAGHSTSSPPPLQQSKTSKVPKSTKISHMAEPPAKRAKRTDSSTMWERNSIRATDTEHKPRSTNEAGSTREKRDEREKRGDRERPDERERRDERDRYHGRDDRRHRSRSRDRAEKRRERSRSRERDRDRDGRSKKSRSRDRDGGRHKNGERGEDREKRDRRRSISRERHRSRRDDPPLRRTDRHRSRSRSPTRSKPSSTRTRSRTRAQPPKPAAANPVTKPTTKSPPATSPPPTSPHKNASHQDLPPTPAPLTTPISNPTANGTSNPPPPSKKSSKSKPSAKPPPSTEPAPMDVDSDPEVTLMRQLMGFVTFKSTKNKKVPGNNVYGVRKEKKTEYRQYMNRVGGFNRPLSPSR